MIKSTMAAAALLAAFGVASGAAAQGGGELWGRIYEVLSHARCANCHVADDVPIWSGPSYGPEPRPHGMYVHGGFSRIGVESVTCSTCHQETNADIPHGPPGAPHWQLAPIEMAWFGRSEAEVCAQITDPTLTGGRDLEAVADHIEHDALVLWGWDPGPGREPAPYSSGELAGFIRAWAALGAPCPTP